MWYSGPCEQKLHWRKAEQKYIAINTLSGHQDAVQGCKESGTNARMAHIRVVVYQAYYNTNKTRQGKGQQKW